MFKVDKELCNELGIKNQRVIFAYFSFIYLMIKWGVKDPKVSFKILLFLKLLVKHDFKIFEILPLKLFLFIIKYLQI